LAERGEVLDSKEVGVATEGGEEWVWDGVRYVGEEGVAGLEEGSVGMALEWSLGEVEVGEVHGMGECRGEVGEGAEKVT